MKIKSSKIESALIKAIIIFIITACFYSCAGNDKIPASIGSLKPIKLPKPQTNIGKPLMQALKERKSIRSLSAKELPDQVISNLLWAAFGVNRSDSGNRTAPSAVNWQVVDIYVALKKGLFIYNAKGHRLDPVLARDVRNDTFTALQPLKGSLEVAPVNLIYVADSDKRSMLAVFTDKSEEDLYAAADTGFISQNVYLFCASEGLGTVVRGMVDKPALRKIMGLRPDQKIILAQTVGYPK